MNLEIKKGNIMIDGGIVASAPWGPSVRLTSDMFRPSSKTIYIDKKNIWVTVWFFHDGSPMEITLAEGGEL